MYHQQQYYPVRQFTPFSVSSGYSSQVSTPAITPPLVSMTEAMMSHQPGWLVTHHPHSQEAILHRISELQAQTAQLVDSLIGQKNLAPPQYTVPAFVAPPSPAPPVAVAGMGGYHEAMMAAQSVLGSVPAHMHMEESVLARAVVAAANALVNRSGQFRTNLVVPQAVRSQTPAWINQAAACETSAVHMEHPGLVFSQYGKAAESPAPSEGSPGISKSASPLADVLQSLSKNGDLDRPPVFGGSIEPKSPGTVMKCQRLCEDH